MKYLKAFTILLLSVVFFSSCVSNKKLYYLQKQSADELVSKAGKISTYDVEDYRFQYNDIVDINMKTTSLELNEMLQIDDNSTQLRSMAGMSSGDAFFLIGYTIDSEGMVELPLVGRVKLVGLNVNEAKNAVEEKLAKFVNENNYFVRVRLGGIRYSAIGEFNRPGKFTILQNRLTIFEAIANAGDLTTVAKRNEVTLMRQYPDGIKTYTINLLNEKIVDSEFFFIRPNDMIYARPLKVKQVGAGVTLVQSFQIILAVATLYVLYLNATN